MPLVKINDFNALIGNKPWSTHKKTNKTHMKNLLKCQEIMTMQQETYYIICTIKIIMNAIVFICQDKQIQVFFHKLIL